MRLIASDLALRIITALRHTGPTSLARLAEILRVQPSSCQRALGVLLADRLVAGIGEGRARVYALEEKNRALAAVEGLADALVPAQEALVIVGNANPAVELIGVTSDELVTVLAKRTTTTNHAQAVAAIKHLADALKLAPQFFDHQDLVRARDLAVQLRHKLSSGEVLVGHLDRSIPDRSGHRKTAGRALGHVSPALHLPSERTLRSIKRRHGVHRLKLFGSAVRTDFRPESDVDIAVTLDPGLRPDPASLEALEAELEKRLGHDVDLVLESELRPPVRYLVDRESVSL